MLVAGARNCSGLQAVRAAGPNRAMQQAQLEDAVSMTLSVETGGLVERRAARRL
jgi:hypothetical protein